MSIADLTWERLEADGFGRDRKPEDCLPELPVSVTELTDDRLMQLYGAYVAWAEYADTLLTQARADRAEAETSVDIVQAQAQARAEDQRTVAAKKAAAMVDPQVRAALAEKLRADAYAEGLAVVLRKTERRIQLLSRELSRRLGRHEHQARGGKWGL